MNEARVCSTNHPFSIHSHTNTFYSNTRRLASTVWQAGGCRSWYLTSEGGKTTDILWPGHTLVCGCVRFVLVKTVCFCRFSSNSTTAHTHTPPTVTHTHTKGVHAPDATG